MPNWKKVIVSGSDAALNSLNVATNVVAQSFTGSLSGTSSNVQGGSQYYIPLWNTTTSLTSSYLYQSGSVLKTIYSGQDRGLTLDYNFNSFVLGNAGVGNNTYLQVFDGGSTINIYSPNYTYFNDKVGIRIIPTNPGLAISGALEVTGPGTSKFMNTNVQIDGNLFMSGSNRLIYNDSTTNSMLFGFFDGGNIYGPYYQIFGNQYANTTQRGSAEFVYDNRNGGGSGFNIASFNGSTWTRKFRVDDNGAQVTGSLEVTNGITGSLFGTASWAINALTASSAETASNIIGGSADYLPIFKTATTLSSSVVYQSGSHIAINETNFTSGDPEALYVFQTHPTSFNVVTGKGNSNNYLQLNIQNTNTGTSASSDIVATANNGTETSNYIDMGINGSNFSGPIGDPNDAYLYSTGNHLHIGNTTPGQPVQFFVGGDDTNLNRKLQLNDNNQHNMTGSFSVSGSVTAFNFTGSLLGTASYADNANSASYALTASYAFNTTSASFAATASSADDFIVRGTLTAQTIVAQTITSSTEYVTGSTIFGSLLSNTHQFTGSVSITGSLAVNGSDVILTNQTSSMTVLSSSHAISASYVQNALLLNGTSSATFATTGSNIFLGNQTVTGSLFTTGSNTLIGSTTLTGSLNITGSTTQIGNNTLNGNTTLTGSVTISGSLGTTNPSIKIYGDIQQAGYHRFDPVTTNIDTTISASYIYVSGSTQDLYFSQNSKGFNNITRLRWIEGNLYTGLLHGGVITSQSSTVYQISSGSGIIVNLNASLNDDPYPTIKYLNWGTLSASIAPLTSSYQQAFVGIDNTGSIYQQGTPFSDGQFDTLINIGSVFFQNGSTINGFKTQPSTAYGFEQAQNVFNRAFGPLKLSGYTLAPSGSSTGSLIVGSGTAYAPGANYTVDPNNPSYTIDSGTQTSKIFRYYQSGSSWVYLTNGGAGFGAIDPTQYSNNGVLTTIGSPGTTWTIQRVFWFPNSVTKAIVVYYGNATYPTDVEAIANINVESFVEAPNTAANAIYLGAIIIKGNGVFTQPADYKIIPGGLFRQVGGSGGGGSVVTQTLSGLSDVSISGPTSGQALVYDTTTAKWRNLSFISASISGNAATATTASYALTASYVENAQTASYVLNAVSSSFASTASFVQNAQTASYVLNAVSASYALNSTTASYALSALSASNALTASYVLNAISASNALTASYILNAVSASYALAASSAQTASYVLQAVSASFASTASFVNPLIQTVLITGSLNVSGSSTIVGPLTANNLTGSLFGTASWANNAITSSNALTASHANSGFTIGTTQTYTSIVASTVVGSNNVFTQSTGSYTSAFYKYTVSNGGNARSGEVIAVWNGTSVQYTDYSTLDLGSTSNVTPSVTVVGPDVLFNINTGTSGWRLKSTVTYL